MPGQPPPADDLDRDRFYGRAVEEKDVGDYELEAPDPEVESARERLARESVADVASRIDVDELMREHENFDHDAVVRDFFRGGKPRFQTKHLLIITALLSIFLAIGNAPSGFALATFLYLVAGVCAALYYFNRKEKQHAAKLARRKRQLRAELRSNKSPAPLAKSPPEDIDDAWPQTMTQVETFRFSFSLQQMMVGVTIAVAVLGLIVFSGGIGGAALTLGLLAAFGLVVHAVGYEPPPMVVLGWWLVLVMYVVLSIGGIVWTAFTAA